MIPPYSIRRGLPSLSKNNFILSFVNLAGVYAFALLGEREDKWFLKPRWDGKGLWLWVLGATASGICLNPRGYFPPSWSCPNPACSFPSWESGGLGSVSRNRAGFSSALSGSVLGVCPITAMWWLGSSTTHRICNSFWKLYCEVLLWFSRGEVFASVLLLASFKCECAFI